MHYKYLENKIHIIYLTDSIEYVYEDTTIIKWENRKKN